MDSFQPQKKYLNFYGCFFHGCPKCYPSNRERHFNHINGLTMDVLYRKTLERERSFIEKDFKIIKIFECDLKRLRESSKQIDEYFINHLRYFNSIKYSPPLQPREAFFVRDV